MIFTKLKPLAAACALLLCGSRMAVAAIALQNATADFSQGGFEVYKAINGTLADDRGWAVGGNLGAPNTAVFETANNLGFGGGSVLTFSLYQTHSNLGHTIGRFRFSATTDNRNNFADGLVSGGDVSANWIILAPQSANSTNGSTLTILGDNSILASGLNPGVDVYTVTAPTNLVGISGLRIETLTDGSLPNNGPGRGGGGNFVLSEFEVDITGTPEPAGAVIVVAIAATFGLLRRRLLTAIV